MKIAILCVLFTASVLHAFTIPRVAQTSVSDQPAKEQPLQPDDHKIDKRFVGSAMLLMNALMDDDDYFDDFTLNGNRGRRPSRRTIQLAQMIRQLAGPQGLTRAQMQNMLQNLQNLQTLQNLQQLQGLQNLQGTQLQQLQGLQNVQGAQPQAG